MEGTPDQFVRVIASGSRGNATFVRLDGKGVLVDAGVPLSRIRKGLGDIGVGWEDIDAVVVTHEHSDHIRGLGALVSACPHAEVFASPGTAREAKLDKWTELRPGHPRTVGPVELYGFDVQHDAAQPIQLRIESSDSCVVVATDIGHWTEEVVEHLKGAQVAVLEANHDRTLLARGSYPAFLKRRIGGNLGHLSNHQARLLLERAMTDDLTHVVLAHMSEKNNEVLLALETIGEVLVGCDVTLTAASQGEPHPVIRVPRGDVQRCAAGPVQRSLF